MTGITYRLFLIRFSLTLSLIISIGTIKKIQAQVVINGAGFINIIGAAATPAYLVLANPPATPITTVGTTGGIMMETEYSVTKYEIGAGTTSINVPYFSSNSGTGVQFPLGVTGISGGVGVGSLQFSSKNAVTVGEVFTSGWENSQYMPTDVTNMNGWMPVSTYTADNSLDVVDRFWIIDEIGYTTSPAVTLSFGFVLAEANANGSNAISSVNNLEAEAFDRTANIWGNYGPVGAYAAGPGPNMGTVSGGISLPAGQIGNQFRSWVLVDKLSPLPVDLLNFSGRCLNKGTNITWSTATEINSNYFSLEKSTNGENFTWLTNINAVGNSTHKQDYSYFDNMESSTTTYYRLSETDRNGNTKVFNIITVNNCNESGKETINVFSGNGNINLSVYSLSNQSVTFNVYDVTGRLIYKNDLQAIEGNNKYTVNPTVANGIYVVEVETNTASLTKRVPIIN